MSKKVMLALAAVGLLVSAMPSVSFAQAPASEWAIHSANEYQVIPNVVYMDYNGYQSKLDVYKRRDTQAAQPTLIFYHGGGWVRGTKEASFMSVMPWLEMGWNVVSVEYRMANVALAPAAVEDSMCALRHVVQKAKDYGVDAAKIVVTGESAGAHLALAVGMIPESAGFTRACAGGGFRASDTSVPKVAAIINWYGITDVTEMLGGPNARDYAVQWLGAVHNREEIAKAISPMTYANRTGLPPILSIQGDADPIVPYSQNTRFLEALKKAGANAELFTVPAGGHGNFKADERTKIYAKIREFLQKNGLGTPMATSTR